MRLEKTHSGKQNIENNTFIPNLEVRENAKRHPKVLKIRNCNSCSFIFKEQNKKLYKKLL